MSQEKYLCMTEDGHFTHKWCTFEAMDNYSIKVQASYMAILVVYGLIIIRYFIRIISKPQGRRGYHIFGEVYLHIYIILICWLLCAIIKVAINLSVYLNYMWVDFNKSQSSYQKPLGQDDKDVPANSPIVINSLIFHIFDFLCIYSLLFLIILIPYQWLTGMLQSITDDTIDQVRVRKRLEIYFTILKIVRIYYKYIRVIFIPFILCQPFLLYYADIGCQFANFNYTLIIIESLLIFVFYVIGWHIYEYLARNRLIKLSQGDLRKIKIQYALLNLALLGRTILNFYFRVLKFYNYTPNLNCSDTNEQNKILATIFLVLAHYIMHIMTISIIIYIYRPYLGPKNVSERQSLMQSSRNEFSENEINGNIQNGSKAIIRS